MRRFMAVVASSAFNLKEFSEKNQNRLGKGYFVVKIVREGLVVIGNGRNTVSRVLFRRRELTEFWGKLGEFCEKLGEFAFTHKK